MPLIDITLNPGYHMPTDNQSGRSELDYKQTQLLVKNVFARSLPGLMVDNAWQLGLDPTTPADGVQVMCHDYGMYTVNGANVWIKIQFSEDRPSEDERLRIRDLLYIMLIEWFHVRGYTPDGIMMDLFWGPSNGKGSVNGVEIEW